MYQDSNQIANQFKKSQVAPAEPIVNDGDNNSQDRNGGVEARDDLSNQNYSPEFKNQEEIWEI
jgi:hypothetical protein